MRKLLVFLLVLTTVGSLDAMCSRQTNSQHNRFSGDAWYGPGFYYGVWFDDEEAYWEWRENHADYPANTKYYHPEHPVEYTPMDHGGH